MADKVAAREARAHRSAEVRIRKLRTLSEQQAAAGLLWSVWGAESEAERDEVITVDGLAELAKADHYVAGAFRGGEIVGCCVGLVERESGREILHSQIAGVAPSRQNKGVGFELKTHQRRWALKRGIDTIRWTFDPLVRRNAHFNLVKLAATVTGYQRKFYGRLDDGTNNRDETDRLLVEWDLKDERVRRAVESTPYFVEGAIASAAGVQKISVPEKIEILRRDNPDEALGLRHEMRERFEDLLRQGYEVAGMNDNNEYVLVLPDTATAGS